MLLLDGITCDDNIRWGSTATRSVGMSGLPLGTLPCRQLNRGTEGRPQRQRCRKAITTLPPSTSFPCWKSWKKGESLALRCSMVHVFFVLITTWVLFKGKNWRKVAANRPSFCHLLGNLSLSPACLPVLCCSHMVVVVVIGCFVIGRCILR